MIRYETSAIFKLIFAWFILLHLVHGTKAQDVETVIKAPMLAANGGVSLSQIATYIPGDNSAPNLYAWYLAGSLNLNFFSVINIPLSFAYTNQQFNSRASLPFNRFSITPSYKWIKIYAGYSSLYFSPYTLSGHEILGGGVELTPDNGFKISAVYGRLQKAVDETADNSFPAYQRMGGGLKVEYSGTAFDAGMSLFKAKDDPSSAQFINPDSIALSPQDNLSASTFLNVRLIDNLLFGIEYAISFLNRDIGISDSIRKQVFDEDGDLAKYHAVKSNLSYQSSIGTIGVTYERIAPNYTTLGSYYMLNDFENITANFSTSLKNVNIALDGGYQRDNLNKQKTNTTSRMIFSGNLSTVVGKKLSLGASLSNIQSYVHIRDIYNQITQTNEYQNLDTLNFTQLNYTMSLNAGYVLQSTQQQRQSINSYFMYQKAAEKQEYTSYSGNDIYNSSLSYQYSQIPKKLNVSLTTSYNHNKMPDSYIGTINGNLSIQKSINDKIKTSFIGTYSNMFSDSDRLANIINLRLTGGYTLQKRHNFNLGLAMLHNKGQSKTTIQYSANLSYSYVFNFLVLRKDKGWRMDANF